jgi:glucokinase
MYTYDPEMIIMGGSVRYAFPYFQRTMWKQINTFAYPKSLKNFKIEVSELEAGGVLGAAALYYDMI